MLSRILIITFGRDTLIDAEDAAKLKATYSLAEHVYFSDSGHLGIISRASDIATLIAKLVHETR